MRLTQLLPLILCLFLSPALGAAEQAPTPKLLFPLACTLGKTCWTARYNDHAPDTDRTDFMCGIRTEEKHHGTDFAIRDLGEMEKGVDVLAAASGTVWKLRDGVTDEFVTDSNRDEKYKIGNGNTIVLMHTGGMTTQYSHMKNGSLTVKIGDSVIAGQKIGEVGLSGWTQYPHLHFAVWQKNDLTDPFDGAPVSSPCAGDPKKHTPLWQEPITYEDTALVYASLTTAPLAAEAWWDAQAPVFAANSPAMVLTGRAFGALKGDKWQLKIIQPNGQVFYDQTVTLKQNRQLQVQYGGRKKPAGGFAAGVWTGEITISRQKPDGTTAHYSQTASILVE